MSQVCGPRMALVKRAQLDACAGESRDRLERDWEEARAGGSALPRRGVLLQEWPHPRPTEFRDDTRRGRTPCTRPQPNRASSLAEGE